MHKNSVVRARYLGECDSSESKFSGVEHASVHSGRKPGYLCKVSRYQWQASQRSFIDNSPKSGIVGLNQRTLGGNLRLLEDCRQLKANFDALRFRDGNAYLGL